MKIVLFYHEDDTAIENQWSTIDQWLGMFNFSTIVIDRVGDFAHVSNVYGTLDDAWADPQWRSYTWVYMRADDTLPLLDEYAHPADNVIYCVGSDSVGFDGKTDAELNGDVLTIRSQQIGRSYYAATIVPIICYDAWLFAATRRAP